MTCPDCKGSGMDTKKTVAARAKGLCDDLSWIRCWTCVGNGIVAEEKKRD